MAKGLKFGIQIVQLSKFEVTIEWELDGLFKGVAIAMLGKNSGRIIWKNIGSVERPRCSRLFPTYPLRSSHIIFSHFIS